MRWYIILKMAAVFFMLNAIEPADAFTGENSSAFDKTAEKNTIEAYQEFLKKYPDGIYASQAQKAVETLRYCQARLNGTEEGYKKFLDDFPDSRFSPEIRHKIIGLEVLDGALSKGTSIVAGISKGKEAVEKEGRFRVVNNSGVHVEAYGVAENNFEFQLSPGEKKDFSLKGFITLLFKSKNMEFEAEPHIAYAEGKNHLIELSLEHLGNYSGKLKIVETKPAEL